MESTEKRGGGGGRTSSAAVPRGEGGEEQGVREGWMKSEEWGTRIRDGWLGRVLRGVEGSAQERMTEAVGGYTGDRVESRGEKEGGGGWWSGWLVGDALRELPAARSRDSYPRPIIDRSPEERRTHCTHQALYLALYQFSEDILKAKIETERW